MLPHTISYLILEFKDPVDKNSVNKTEINSNDISQFNLD